jgi:methylthioribose-1-phosphate isomerase
VTRSTRTVYWQDGKVKMIDQRLLPDREETLVLEDVPAVAEAIRDMAVRGAPAIGATAAYGLALGARLSKATDVAGLRADLERDAALLEAARPTASNLGWALRRVLGRLDAETTAGDGQADRLAAKALEIPNNLIPEAEPRAELHPNRKVQVQFPAANDRLTTLRALVLAEAERIADDDVVMCRSMGAHGAALLPDPARVIHHCNTGALATVDFGTALGVIRAAHEAGKQIHVLVDETRPRLQGARLTTWELAGLGIPQTLIADGAAGHHLRTSKVDAVLVGADRIAANGDAANKIGTYPLAVVARENGVPVYVVAPTSTVDLAAADGDAIPIEDRGPEEVTHVDGRRIAPLGVSAANPAFDVTPHRYITAIVTEMGVIRPPFAEGLRAAVAEAEAIANAAAAANAAAVANTAAAAQAEPAASATSDTAPTAG